MSGRSARGKGAQLPGEVIRRRARRLRSGRVVRSFLVKLVLFALFVYAVFFVFFGVAVMRGNDMKPRFYAGDVLLFYRLERDFAAGDVIVFQKDGRQYVARIVACPGDEVAILDGGGLAKNGANVIEDDVFYQTYPLEGAVQYPLKLGAEEFFVLCDYRAGGKDSRFFGAVHLTEIEGKVFSALRRRGL